MKKYPIILLFVTFVYAMGMLGYFILEQQEENILLPQESTQGFYVVTEKQEEVPPLEEVLIITFPINLNTACQEELEALPNIGAQRASDIISYRETVGDFQSLEEIMDISGIGPSTYEGLKELVILWDEEED